MQETDTVTAYAEPEGLTTGGDIGGLTIGEPVDEPFDLGPIDVKQESTEPNCYGVSVSISISNSNSPVTSASFSYHYVDGVCSSYTAYCYGATGMLPAHEIPTNILQYGNVLQQLSSGQQHRQQYFGAQNPNVAGALGQNIFSPGMPTGLAFGPGGRY